MFFESSLDDSVKELVETIIVSLLVFFEVLVDVGELEESDNEELLVILIKTPPTTGPHLC